MPHPHPGRGHKERVHAKTPASTLQMLALAPGTLALGQWITGCVSEGQGDPDRSRRCGGQLWSIWNPKEQRNC